MNKHYIFIGMVFFLAFLVIQFVITGYKNSQRVETLKTRENEISRDEAEISRLTTRAKWGDTAAARVYLKKLNNNVQLPGERLLILVPKEDAEYSVDTAINAANKEEQVIQEMTIPEKWNALIWGNGLH